MFSAIIIDDEPLAIEALRGLCGRSPAVRIVDAAAGGVAGLALVERHRPDAIFLDIGMPGMDGLAVAARLGALARPPLVVLVTAYDHFATQAFDLAVVDYVLKPVLPARLDRAIDRVTARLAEDSASAAAEEFWLPSRGGMVRIATSAIARVEAERDYVRIFDDVRSYLLRGSISALAARLDPRSFIRVHRSTILRRDGIVEVRRQPGGGWIAVGACGRVTPIGRSYIAHIRALLDI